VVLRGTEGEPVVDPRRRPRMDAYARGTASPAASCLAQEGVVSDMPLLPNARDAASTALYVQSLLAGEKPMPAPLAQQIRLVLALMADIEHPAPRPSLPA